MFTALFAAMAFQPVPTALPPVTEDMRGQYFAEAFDTGIAQRLVPAELANASVFSLAGYLNAVEDGISQCRALREEMTALISTDFGSYAVHPTWLSTYQTCILTRNREISDLGKAIAAARPALVDGLEGESALRATDVIARLSVYQTQIKGTVADEVRAQKSFIALYNRGGGTTPAPVADLE